MRTRKTRDEQYNAKYDAFAPAAKKSIAIVGGAGHGAPSNFKARRDKHYERMAIIDELVALTRRAAELSKQLEESFK